MSYALYLLLAPPSSVLKEMLGRNGVFALVDGLLALAVAFALSKAPPWQWLFVLALVDALVRLAIAAVAFANPDLESRILGSVVFFGAVISVAIALGVVGLIYVQLGRRVTAGGPRGGAVPALLISACTVLFGVGVMFGFSTADGRRMLVGAFALAIGLICLATGLRLGGGRSD